MGGCTFRTDGQIWNDYNYSALQLVHFKFHFEITLSFSLLLLATLVQELELLYILT